MATSRLLMRLEGLLQRLCTCHPRLDAHVENFRCDLSAGILVVLEAVITYSDDEGNITASTVFDLFTAWIEALDNSSVVVDGINHTLCLLTGQDSPCSSQLSENSFSTATAEIQPTLSTTLPASDLISNSEHARFGEFSGLFIGGMLLGIFISSASLIMG